MKMRAAVLEESGRPLNITEVELDEPHAGEVLVRLEACGVCHSLITGRRVCGSSFGGVKGRDQVPQFVQLNLDGKLDVDALISHRIAVLDVNRGFELMERRTGSAA